jgi:hypothetical protein
MNYIYDDLFDEPNNIVLSDDDDDEYINLSNLDDKSDKIAQPIYINIDLKEHQKCAVHAMRYLECNESLRMKDPTFQIETNIGVLGDKVGAGKTLTSLSLINQKRIAPRRPQYNSSSKYACIKYINKSNAVKTNLIIVPHKIIHQWVNTLKITRLKYIKINNIRDFNKLSNECVEDYDVVLITDTKVKSFLNLYNNIIWGRTFVDEIDTIILPRYAFNSIKTNFLWLITATPTGLMNTNKPFLVQVFRKMDRRIIDSIIVKNNDSFVDQAMKLPIPKRCVINCLTPPEFTILSSFVSPEILGLVNSGNLDEAIKQLNCNVDTDKNILQVITKNFIDELNAKKEELGATKKLKNMPIAEKQHKIKILENRIKSLNTRIESIKIKIESIGNEICQICLGNFVKPAITPCCHTIFCFECALCTIGKTNKCVICNKIIKMKDLQLFGNEKNKKKKIENKLLDKFDMLDKILKQHKNKKIMIFSTFGGTFSKIKIRLDERCISYNILKGHVVKTIEDYEKGKINVLMLNARYFGAGLNLHMTDVVILFHRFKRELEEQVIGRAQRLGRTGQLLIYYLIHEGEETVKINDGKMEDIENPFDENSDEENTDDCMDNETVVFTGFRNDKLEKWIIKNGGMVINNVSTKVTLVITKGNRPSIKLHKAKQLNIKITTYDDFIKLHKIKFDNKLAAVEI